MHNPIIDKRSTTKDIFLARKTKLVHENIIIQLHNPMHSSCNTYDNRIWFPHGFQIHNYIFHFSLVIPISNNNHNMIWLLITMSIALLATIIR